MSQTIPTIDEQWAQLREIGALWPVSENLPSNPPRRRVRFSTSDFVWEVEGFFVIKPKGQLVHVRLVSPTSGRRRTAFSWELRAVK